MQEGLFDEETFNAIYDAALVRRIRKLTKARDIVGKEWSGGSLEKLLEIYIAHHNKYALHKCEDNEMELEMSQVASSLIVSHILKENGYTQTGIADTWIKEDRQEDAK